jgi:N-acylneuraminate cytidylyltransferase
MIALILARGGSKSIPKKNIKILGDKPLIGHVINSGFKTKNISEIYVSTDCDEISDISKFYGAKIIKRPDELSQDFSTDIDGFIHALDFIPKSDEIIHLRATTPLVDPCILDQGINFYLENKKNCTSMRSGHETPESAYKYFKIHDKYFKGLFDNESGEYYNLPRQKIPKTFKPNGYIDIVKTDIFKTGETFHGNNILAFITPITIEIDSIEEFEYLEYLIQNKNKNK